MNAANLGNTSSESNIRSRVRCKKWAEIKANRRREMVMTLDCGSAVVYKVASDQMLFYVLLN
jgi:hypothetical protein